MPEPMPRKPLILIADDVAKNLQMVAQFLIKAGFEVTGAHDGATAVTRARHSLPDLILMDFVMPGQSGVEACRTLKADPATREIPVIFLTARDSIQDIIAGFAAGGIDYITKPFEFAELIARIRTHLELKASREEYKLLHERKCRDLQRETDERLRVERVLEQQRVLAMRHDRLKSLGEMAAGIAHELNQPLVGVRGLAEHLLLALERGWHMDPEKIRTKVQLIIEQADRMSHIIEHVRLFSREAGQPGQRPVEVNQVIRSSLDLVGEQIRHRGIDLTADLGQDLPQIMINPYSLEEVVLNLVNNARDAVEEKLVQFPDLPTPHIVVQTRAREYQDASSVMIELRDRGIGICREHLEKVFEPFFTTKSPDRGTGLGLAISRAIVLDSRGEMTIRSEPGQGSCVTISLPALPPGDQHRETPKENPS